MCPSDSCPLKRKRGRLKSTIKEVIRQLASIPTDEEQSHHAPLWHQRIHVRFGIAQLLVLSLIVGATITVLFTVERALLLEQGFGLAEQLGHRMVAQLGERVVLAETLTASLANLGETLEPDEERFHKVIPHLLNYENHESFLAGGGIWPEPGFFTPGVERRSFFWGRDDFGKLRYYDNYNEPDGPGYHNEEWYVPARYLSPGKGFWSKSYMDPYSLQPMVTCTVPMHRAGHFAGVATVDVKLEGLDSYFREVATAVGGYIFALDRNNKFLSYPRPHMVRRQHVNENGDRTEELIYIRELARLEPTYETVAETLDAMTDSYVRDSRDRGSYREELVTEIANSSYQINEEEARRIVAGLSGHGNVGTESIQRLFWDSDPILGGPVMATLIHMPRTHWNVVIVTPSSRLHDAADLVTRKVALYVVSLELLGLFILFFLMRHSIIKPIRTMSNDLVAMKNSNQEKKLDESSKNELGYLAKVFNQSNRMLAEQNISLKRTQRALRESEERFSRFMEHMPGPALMRDESQHLLFINPYYTKVFGNNLGRHISDIMPPEQAREVMDQEHLVLEGNITTSQVEKATLDDKTLHFLVQRFPIPREGKTSLVGALALDISEQIHAQEALSAARDNLERRVSERTAELRRINNELQGFAQIVSHDLRAPLTNISGFNIELQHCFTQAWGLIKEQDLSTEHLEELTTYFEEDIPDAIKYIAVSVKRMDRMIQAILGLARMGHRELRPMEINMASMVRGILQTMEHQIQEARGKTEIGDLPPLRADREAVEQIVSNLLDNAVKYLSPEREGFIRIEGSTDGTRYTLKISDNGRGIRTKDLERIFQIFRRTGDEEVPGEGMGLAYVRALVRRMDGQISCTSQWGEGTTFCLEIPEGLNKEEGMDH